MKSMPSSALKEHSVRLTGNSADTDTKITKFGISFNSDGTTTFFAQLEKHQPVRKNILKKFRKRKLRRRKRQRKRNSQNKPK